MPTPGLGSGVDLKPRPDGGGTPGGLALEDPMSDVQTAPIPFWEHFEQWTSDPGGETVDTKTLTKLTDTQ